MLGKRLALATALFALSPAAAADSLTDHFGPRETSLGESQRADAQGALATTLNPAGLALTRQLVFEGSYGYRADDSTSSVAVSACDSTVPVPGCFYYHYLTSKPEVDGMELSRRVHEFGIAAARAITRRFSIGLNTRYFDHESELAGEEDSSGFATDVGMSVRASESIQLGVVGYNLLAADSVEYPMGVGAGISLRPTPQLSIGLDGLWNLDLPEGSSTGRYGGGIEYFFQSEDRQSGYPLRIGALHDRTGDATYLTGGLGLTTTKIGIDIGARRQVDGGDEWLLLGSLRLFGPHLP
ncbi:MAG TPA: hypothetical protein VK698_09100 [Kofleriaceae bacterium]|nr:hypothetical protein [Kofleriaceae bacterium]